MPASRNKRILDLPASERPREKFLKKGAATLSDHELLALLVGSGNASTDVNNIARQLQRLMDSQTTSLTYKQLTTIKGVNTVTAARILASLELVRRHLIRDSEPLTSMAEILARLSDMRGRQQEYLACLSLDGGQRLISQRLITVGTLDSVAIHPREIFAEAIVERAASIIVAHNHPSGQALPSAHDVVITQQLISAGHLLGIKLYDHIIVTKHDYYSYRQKHLL